MKAPAVDYRRLRLGNIGSPEFSHVLYLLYWPIYGLLFLTVERLWIRDSYVPVHCALDDMIPFNELFVFPYLFWFVYLIGTLVYTFFWEPRSFRDLMRFIVISCSTAIAIYMVFPNCQELRPLAFERDNLITRFLGHFYRFDTNTNVCPSIHVIASVAVAICAWHSDRFGTPGWRLAFVTMAVLISLSTLFLKQHSVIDVLGALPVCAVTYLLVYGLPRRAEG